MSGISWQIILEMDEIYDSIFWNMFYGMCHQESVLCKFTLTLSNFIQVNLESLKRISENIYPLISMWNIEGVNVWISYCNKAQNLSKQERLFSRNRKTLLRKHFYTLEHLNGSGLRSR